MVTQFKLMKHGDQSLIIWNNLSLEIYKLGSCQIIWHDPFF